MNRLSIAIISNENSSRELRNLKDFDSFSGTNPKAFLVTTTGKGFEIAKKKENGIFYLVPFLSKDQLSLFEFENKILVLELSPSLFSILFNSEIKLSKDLKDSLNHNFVNREVIEIESVYCGVPDLNSLISLPSCPICLKRLDKSISGFDTIKCRDLFHSCCRDTCKSFSEGCPVCKILFDSIGQKFSCSDCGSFDNLWICLICANLGCGRYKGGHAHNHFLSSGHSFALKLDSHHIWDYSMDKYVHWRIKNAEGTVVDVDEDISKQIIGIDIHENIDGVAQPVEDFVNDFTSAQLESQKYHFEDRLISIKNEHNSEILKLKATQEKAKIDFNEEIHRLNHERNILSNLNSQYQDLIKKLKLQCTSVSKDLEIEREISKGLMKSNEKMKIELDESVLERTELEEQVKDLMKHIEVLDLMGKAGNIPDIVEGKLLMRPVKNKKKATK